MIQESMYVERANKKIQERIQFYDRLDRFFFLFSYNT